MGQKNVIYEPLISRRSRRIIFPPLHIKHGLIKQFVKVFDKKGPCFKYIGKVLPAISIDELNAVILDGPQIQRLIKDDIFVLHVTTAECAAWNFFAVVVKEFLGKTNAANSKELVQVMLTYFHALEGGMSLQIHYLFSHLDKLPENLGDVNEVHQDIMLIEERYQGQ